jgi:replicative DNA helicase
LTPSSLLLSSILHEPALLEDVRLRVRDEWWPDARHRAIWKTACALRDRGANVTLHNLLLELDAESGLEAKILDADWHVPDVELWCEQMRDQYVAGETLRLVGRHGGKPAELYQALGGLLEGSAVGQSVTMAGALKDALAGLGEERRGWRTGMPSLDRVIGGLHGGELIVVAGRPGHGKTSFALNLAQHAAVVDKAKVLAFSYEMTRRELAMRMLCSLADVGSKDLERKRLDADAWRRLERAAVALEKASIEIDDTASLSAAEICARIRSAKPDLVLVDYLQLLPVRGRSENRHLEIAAMTRALKLTALQAQVPIVLLSQLNRETTKRKDRRPHLAELRESGAIESDADVVVMLHREELYAPDDRSEHGYADVLIRKQRNGPLADLRMAFIGSTTTFAELEEAV